MKQTKKTLPFPFPPKSTKRSMLARVRAVDPSFKLRSNLVGYWPGHGVMYSSALRAWDASNRAASRINADGEAGVSLVTSSRGPAMRTPGGGTLSAWNVPSNTRFDTIPFTISMWVKLKEIESDQTKNHGVLSRHDSSFSRNGITCYLRLKDGSGNPVTPTWGWFIVDNGGTEALTWDNVQAVVDTWYHIAVTVVDESATGLNGYIDGRLFAGAQASPQSTTPLTSFAFNSQDIRWGQVNNFGVFHDTKADFQHVMWFNKALTGQEIAWLREHTWDVGNLGAGAVPLLFSDPDLPQALTQDVVFGSLFNYEGEFERSVSQNVNFASSFTADSAVENGVVFGSTFNADQPEGSFRTDVRFGSRFTVETSDLASLRYRR